MTDQVYSNNEEHILTICVQIINVVAFLSCLSVIVLYFKFKSIQSLATKILFWISICGLFETIAVFLSIDGALDKGGLCTLQAFLSELASISSLLFSTVITVIIYKVLLNSNNTSFVLFYGIRNWWIKFQIFAWSFSLLFAIIPLFVRDAYGPSGGLCWIVQTKPIHQWLRYLTFYIPWVLCVVSMIILSYKVTKYVYSVEYEQNKKQDAGRVLKTIWYYPLLILFVYLFFAMRRINELITGEAAVFALAVLSLIFGHSRQIINCIIFCFTPNVQHIIKKILCSNDMNKEYHIGGETDVEAVHSATKTDTTTATTNIN